MRRAIIRAKESFSAFGKDYNKGDEVPVEHFSTWPENTLQNRLINGFVEHGSIEVVDPVDAASDEDGEPEVHAGEEELANKLSGMSKAELVEFAQDQYSKELSLQSSKAKLITAILELDEAAKQE